MISSLLMVCSSETCDWLGTIADCENDIDSDGSFGCPVCLSIAEEVIDHEFKGWLKIHCKAQNFYQYDSRWDRIALNYLLWKSRTSYDEEYFFLIRLVLARMENRI